MNDAAFIPAAPLDEPLTRALAFALVEVLTYCAAGSKGDRRAASALVGNISCVADQIRNQAAARHNVYQISGEDRGKDRATLDAERGARMRAAELLADAAGRAERYMERGLRS